jgi:hypothetical protein
MSGAAQVVQVFPVRKYYDSVKDKWAKIPAIPKGTDWRTFKAHPSSLVHSANVGVVIPQGRVAIDLDVYKGVTRQAVEAVLGCTLEWDQAAIQRTVSGGEHYCFTLPEGASVPQGDSLLGVAGFDTRCAGKGWLCTGDGYTDLTLIGMPTALGVEDYPALPQAAIDALNGVKGVAAAAATAVTTAVVSLGVEGIDFVGSVEGDAGDAQALLELESVVAAQPLDDLSEEQMWFYLQRLPAEDLEGYQNWAKAGMAIHHQSGGSNDGLALWARWSQGSSHYDLEECRRKWPSFGRRDHIAKPVRFDYIIHRAGGKAVINADMSAKWVDRAKGVGDTDQYEEIKRELRAVSLSSLGRDQRQQIAKEIYDAFGKAAGISKGAISQAIMPPKMLPRSAGTGGGTGERPAWLEPWVYVEETCEFANTVLNYSIKREAFNAKFDRTGEVVAAQKQASAYALNDVQIPTVVNHIFWPSAGLILEYQGRAMLNSYRAQGVAPCTTIEGDAEAQQVIKRLLDHVAFTLEDPREREILLDWFAFCYQNPGQRVNWALLLQGAQGTGKSYFCVMLQAIMGDLVANLDPAAIAGRFTGWAHGSLVIVIEEVRISGQNKYEVMDRTKPFISNPTIQIEEKGRDHRTVPNFTSYLMLTNFKDALPLVAGDRRYCVMFSRIQSEAQLYAELGGKSGLEAYFDRLFGDLDQRPDAVAHYFKNRKISAHFNARGRAPDTGAKQQMVDVGISPERMVVEDALSQFECAVIGRDLIDITWMNALAEADGLQMPRTRAVSAILLEMGYQQVDGRKVRMQKTKKCHYVWFNPEHIDSDKARDYAKNFHDDPSFTPF